MTDGRSTMNSIKESEQMVDHRLHVDTNKEKQVVYGNQNNLYADEEEEDTKTSLESSHEAEKDYELAKITAN